MHSSLKISPKSTRGFPLPAILALLALLPGAALAAESRPVSNGLWQAQSIYHIITDRFFDGDPSNNNAEGNYDPAGFRGTSVHGGDFAGIEQKLDYIQALGATAIWISPIVLNGHGEFHGYAARDFYAVAPHWGSLKELQRLVRSAHARGMLVINDVIVNHGGNLVDSGDNGYPRFKPPPGGYQLRFRDRQRRYAPPFELNATHPTLNDLFHNHGIIGNYNDPQQSELGELSGLDDFRTETAYVRARMIEIYQFWIQQAGFDGFRVDTVKHVEMGFWQEWCPAIRSFAAARGKPDFFMFGEVLDGSDAKCGSYTGKQAGGAFALDSVLDYPLYFKAREVFARNKASPKQLLERYAAIATNYDSSAHKRLVTFLDNHDQARFLSRENARDRSERLRNALVFLYTAQGIPCLYYGTEQGFNGENDPYDREDMFAGKFEQGPSLGDNFNMTHPLFLWVARLNNLRRLYPALQIGSQIDGWSDPAGPGLVTYRRKLSAQELLVIINTADSARTLTNGITSHPAGTRLVNLLEPSEALRISTGQRLPPITVAKASAKIFLQESELKPLDPLVISASPGHESIVAPGGSPIVLEFDQPMDTNSVQSAFSTNPNLSPGMFSWEGRQKLKFTPGGDGWPPDRLISIRVDKGAKSFLGRPLYAAFEMRFRIKPAPKR